MPVVDRTLQSRPKLSIRESKPQPAPSHDFTDEPLSAFGVNTKRELTASCVAALLAGKSTIGTARRAFERAGWRTCIAGNRLTVSDSVFVQYVGAASDYGAVWTICTAPDYAPICVTSTLSEDSTKP